MATDIKLKIAMDGARVVSADIRNVNRELGGMGNAAASASARARGEMDLLGRSMGGLKTVAGGMFAAVSLGEFVGKLVSVQREFDVLNSSLVTVTGSSAAAAREMEWLKQFAKETPFGLAQVVDGFVKMKALGLDPTQASLTSFGNTASAMGKNLNQMIEAVADASTGEFERLKEFGIKARKSGDDVSFTFQGVTTTIKNSAEEITSYLEQIGNVQFDGAMAERAATLDGAISELGDTWDELFRTINNAQAGSLIYESVQHAIVVISDAISIIEAMTTATDEAGMMSEAFALQQDFLRTAFEALAVVGVNIVYVFEQIVAELRGLYEQAMALLSLDFSRAAAIGAQIRAEAAAARIEVDRVSAAIVNHRQIAAERAAERASNRHEEVNDAGWGAAIGLTKPKARVTVGGGGGKKKTGGGGRKRSAAPRRTGGSAAPKQSDEARAYEAALKAISSAQLTASLSGQDLTATQRKLHQIMASPEWQKMPQTWRDTITAQANGVIEMEKQSKAAQEYKRLVDSLKTDEEQRRDTMREQLGILQAMQGLSPQERSDMGRRIATAATEDAPEFSGIAPEVAGPFADLAKVEEAQIKLQEWYTTQLQMLGEFRQMKGDLIEEANARELELTQQHNQRLQEIEHARLQVQLAGAADVMGQVTDIIRSSAGEQSGIYKAMFAVEKSFAIASAMVNVQAAIAKASNSGPFPWNLAAMASVAAAALPIVTGISSIAMQFREKGGSVRANTPYIVGEAGAELFVPNHSGTIIPHNRLGTGSGGGDTQVTVNLIGNRERAGQVETRRGDDGSVTVEAFVADIYGDGPMAKAITGAFGVRRAGR